MPCGPSSEDYLIATTATRRCTIRSSLFTFATDFSDEGPEVALDRIQHRAGVGGVTMAAVYHHGRDIFPHSPRCKVRYLEGGASFFRPDDRRYRATALRPAASELSRSWDALAAMRQATSIRGMTLDAWTVFCHNTRLGSQHPDTTMHNAFGDPQLTSLCPANPHVVEYARALAGDIARYGCDTVLAEALNFLPLEHGFHHERYLIELGPVDRFLLGLCFCRHCCAVAAANGVDAEGLKEQVGDRLASVFETADAHDPREDSREVLRGLWDGELDAFLDVRCTIVTAAAAAVADALADTGTRLAFMDPAGGFKGYADGRPQGGPAPEASWRFGVDPAALSASCDELQMLGYAQDPERVLQDLRAYQELLAGRCDLRVALRPLPPDCRDASNLHAKLLHARTAGVGSADLYHYGFARLEALDLVRAALSDDPGDDLTHASTTS